MNGFYIYSILLAGFLLAQVLWISRRSGVPLHGQAEIAFLCGAFMVWAVVVTGPYGPLQSSVLLANGSPALAAAYAAPESGVLDNERKISSGPLPSFDSSAAVYHMQNPTSALGAAPSDDRVFLEKFFKTPHDFGRQPPLPALAYAAPQTGILDNEPMTIPEPLPGSDSEAAIYDISAHTVYLPDGTELEAHSGKGGRLDDPRFVHERMRGATPPNVYELAFREKTFHGVQALRLKPIGGGNVFGRSGLLAHTYMLGPKGESNGCVVFKNYKPFLQAFQNGQIKRLIVVDNLNRNSKVTLTAGQDLTAQPGSQVR
jgi:Protein of unknown function (DUF2778)